MFSLTVNNKEFNHFESFDLTLAYNAIADTFSFNGFIDTKNKEQRQLFKPLCFQSCIVKGFGETIITGTILNISSAASSKPELAGVSGYSKSGVIEDCHELGDFNILQSDGLSLKEIAEQLIKPFGLKLVIDSHVADKANEAYVESNAEAGKTIKDYLAELCAQKNLILSHDRYGNVLITDAKVLEQSIATYIEGRPSTRISLNVNGQSMHSKIMALNQSSLNTDVEGEETIENTLIKVYRPRVINQTSGENNDTLSVAKRALADELKEIKLTIETDRWQWYDGRTVRIIRPNNVITVQSPSNFIRNKTNFFVESVSYRSDKNGVNATITAVLPESFTGEVPKNIFS